jgi:hypothetical protein
MSEAAESHPIEVVAVSESYNYCGFMRYGTHSYSDNSGYLVVYPCIIASRYNRVINSGSMKFIYYGAALQLPL